MYGYSLWLVPNEHEKIMEKYDMVHIPHVTIATKMMYLPKEVITKRVFKIRNYGEITKFHKMYDENDLEACGFYCEIHGLEVKHEAHMTIWYGTRYEQRDVIEEDIECVLKFADTRDIDPRLWKLLF